MNEGKSALYLAASWALWPALFAAGLIGAGWAFHTEAPLLWFNVVYLSIVAAIAGFERLMPYEQEWLKHDGETFNDIAHTLLTKGGVQLAAAIGASAPMAIATVVQPAVTSPTLIWPDHWPVAFQVVLGLIIAEFGLYVAHRAAHEFLSLWRFHALHHSVERLWVVNTGRFHVVDSLFKIALSQIPLYLLGAPLPVFLWTSAVTAFIGLLTHCNIDVRTGPLDRIFSTPRSAGMRSTLSGPIPRSGWSSCAAPDRSRGTSPRRSSEFPAVVWLGPASTMRSTRPRSVPCSTIHPTG